MKLAPGLLALLVLSLSPARAADPLTPAPPTGTLAPPVRVQPGSYENPANSLTGGDRTAPLVFDGDVTFGWRTGALGDHLDLAGHRLTVETGGGNVVRLNGALVGGGSLLWLGGGQGHWQFEPSFLGGRTPNVLAALTLPRGTLALAKPPGVNAASGKITLGGGSNIAVLRWEESDQVADDASLTLVGPQPTRLWLRGHTETLGTLDLQGDGEIVLDGGSIHFADSHGIAWSGTGQLIVRGWDRNGGAWFGASAAGLTAQQVARIGFRDPAGMPPGLYRAEIHPDGSLVPASKAVLPAGVPFDLSQAAQAAREKIDSSNGRDRLSLAVKSGMKIAFFGDSITWLSNGEAPKPANPAAANPKNNFAANDQFYNLIGRALDGRGVVLINHAINGGGVREILDGKEHMGGAAGTVFQPSFQDLLGTDRPTVVVIFIGTNDAWWRATPVSDFEAALEQLAKQTKDGGAKLVLVTPAVIGERPDGTNPHDKQLDAVADAVRVDARKTDSALVDLRAASLAYLQNHNIDWKLDGTPVYADSGVLTYDGVHPTTAGAALFADAMAAGIAAVLPLPTPESDGRNPEEIKLVPWPRSIRVDGGTLSLAPVIAVTSRPLQPAASILADDLRRTTGVRFLVRTGKPKRGEIGLSVDARLGPDEYGVTASDRVVLTGRDPAALANAASTLLQLACPTKTGAAVPRCVIADGTARRYRGLMIDVARQPHPIASLQLSVDLCRLYKIRCLQLHLTDDQSWMFPSRQFPKLGAADQAMPPYTLEDLRGLVRYADERGVIIVPELEGPGHCGAAARAMPEIFDAADPRTGAPLGLGCMNMASDRLYDALDALVGELCDTFRSSPYIHMGCDEVGLGGIARAPGYADYLKKHGLSTATDLYCHYIQRVAQMVSRRGRQLVVWEGFPGSGTAAAPVPKNVLVMSFENTYNPAPDLLRNGYRIVNTAWTPLYAPLVRSVIGPEQVYDWNIHRLGRYPAGGYEKVTWLEVPESPSIVGAEMCAWELPAWRELPAERDVLPAMAERLWNPTAARTYADFRTRWAATDRILDRLTLPELPPPPGR